jgi:MarR family transcriptional regulator for hemolysin
MPIPFPPEREFAFMVSDVARMMRTLVDQEARKFGSTRAQWSVLFRLERYEGLKQSELAEILDIQPITLTRLIDRLCDSGLIERRSDPTDRRAKRLFLTPAARPFLDRLATLTNGLMGGVLDGIERPAIENMTMHLAVIKENLRRAILDRSNADSAEENLEHHYG